MNCKPGDLAMIRAMDGNVKLPKGGRFVTCVWFVGAREGHDWNDWWLVDRILGHDHDGYVCDSVLIPIRGDELQGDVERVTPLPQPSKEHA